MTARRPVERRCQGRLAAPSAGALDSQSGKTATQSQAVGFERHKTIQGRKRPLWVDTLGRIVAVVVTAAHVDDREGLVALVNSYCADGVTRLRKLWVEGGARAEWRCAGVWGLQRTHKID
jgi:putative transposase